MHDLHPNEKKKKKKTLNLECERTRFVQHLLFRKQLERRLQLKYGGGF